MKDLILLVADKNMQFALRGALERPEALGIRPIEFDFIVHPGRDGGVRTTGPALLALRKHQFSHALLMLDFEGSGCGDKSAETLRRELNSEISNVWGAMAQSIVIEPELDIWMWGSDNAVEEAIGWKSRHHLRSWLALKGFGFDANHKPMRPKEALENALLEIKQPRSSALYRKIASRISLQRCTDSAFQLLRSQLIRWFPQDPETVAIESANERIGL
jgi:hypothetical protein